MNRSAVLLVILGLACVPTARAQPDPNSKPPETVIVTAPRLHSGVTPNAVAHDFVKSFAAPTLLRDNIARWEMGAGICPKALGLDDHFALYVENRIRKVAEAAGAPVKAKGCRPNLIIAFTPKPQEYLDSLHKQNVETLGYHGSATVTHPIQAWYVTGTRDIRGQIFRDEEAFFDYDPRSSVGLGTSTAPFTNVGGWRFHPDAASLILYATIVVDSSQTTHYQLGEITDYAAMLALAQSMDYDDCQLMPSITNLLSSRCDDTLKPSYITPTDIAFLRGVYKMDAGATLLVQQNQIAGEMAKAIGSK
jgi:hypothetical protein